MTFIHLFYWKFCIWLLLLNRWNIGFPLFVYYFMHNCEVALFFFAFWTCSYCAAAPSFSSFVWTTIFQQPRRRVTCYLRMKNTRLEIESKLSSLFQLLLYQISIKIFLMRCKNAKSILYDWSIIYFKFRAQFLLFFHTSAHLDAKLWC